MKTIHIIYHQFYDGNGVKRKIGGVETYLANLISVLEEYTIIMYQLANKDFEKKNDKVKIWGCKLNNDKQDPYKFLVKEAEKKADIQNDILIFGADLCIRKTVFKKVLAIQHGIGWDIPAMKECSKYAEIKHFVRNVKTAYERKREYKKCTKIICVDYNFVNWYRTFVAKGTEKLVTIPNFTEIREQVKHLPKKNEDCSIIFARRFQPFRGTRVFAEAIENIIKIYPNVKVCIAGEGPDESWLHNKLDKYEQVSFDSFTPEKSVEKHERYDIAVVPSVGSEGTSLSLLEAMSAGCAVVSSDVGGLTSIVIDGFNGLIIRSNVEELFYALNRLIENPLLRTALSERARETVENSFSFEIWKEKWLDIIHSM